MRLTISPSLFAVDDASGHYTTGFFYGNNYWTGSLALCRNIYKNDVEEKRNQREYCTEEMAYGEALLLLNCTKMLLIMLMQFDG